MDLTGKKGSSSDIVSKDEVDAIDGVTVDKILGREFIEIHNLTVSPLPILNVGVGDGRSLEQIIEKTPGVTGIIWNEYEIALIMRDRNTQIKYKPEFSSQTVMFFVPERKRYGASFFDDGVRAWEGDCEPVQFSKRNLLKFLAEYGDQFPPELQESIKKMRVSKSQSQEVMMLDVDSDNERRVEEEVEKSNLPKKFTVSMVVSEKYIGQLDFEAKVVKLKDGYRDTNRLGVELRCVNTRTVLREMMETVLDKLPPELPRYYGAVSLQKS